jgi:ankyrin repeat protein
VSEVTTSFTLRFADPAQADFVHQGFSLLHKGNYAEAKAHFENKKTDLWIGETGADWNLEHYKRDGNYLTGVIIAGPLSFDEREFFKVITRFGATRIVANVFNDQVGEGYTFASKMGKKSTAKAIIKELAAENSNFALSLAVNSGKSKDALALIAQGADPNTTFGGDPLLAVAASNGMCKVALALLEAGADPNAALTPTENYDAYAWRGLTVLHSALQYRCHDLVHRLLETGADPNRGEAGGVTPLHFAFIYDETFQLAKELIEAGATINEPHTYDGLSPFLLMMEKASDDDEENAHLPLEMLDYLVAHGADIHDTCQKGGNAYWYASGHQALRDKLAALGCGTMVAPSDAYDGDISANIATAIEHENNAEFEKLVQGLPSLSQEEKDELLQTAIFLNQPRYASSLIAHGANPAARVTMNKTLFELAADFCAGDTEFQMLLSEKMAPILEKENAAIERATVVLREFEKWFMSLADYDELIAKGEPYFTATFLGRERDSRNKYTFGNLKAMSADTGSELTAFIFGNEGDVRFFRPFTQTNGSSWIGVFTLQEASGVYRINSVTFDLPIDVDERRYRA